MAKAAPDPARAPRGSKTVVQAFFSALDNVPALQQPTVAKAAQAMIRDMLKDRRDATRAAAKAAKERSRQKSASSRRPKAVTKASTVAPKRGRGRPRKVQPTPEKDSMV